MLPAQIFGHIKFGANLKGYIMYLNRDGEVRVTPLLPIPVPKVLNMNGKANVGFIQSLIVNVRQDMLAKCELRD